MVKTGTPAFNQTHTGSFNTGAPDVIQSIEGHPHLTHNRSIEVKNKKNSLGAPTNKSRFDDLTGSSIDTVTAGMTSKQLNTDLKRAMRVLKEDKRKYNEHEEKTRKLHYDSIQIKDHNYYNKTKNLW